MRKLKFHDFINEDDAIKTIVGAIFLVVFVVSLIYEGRLMRNGDYKKTYCEMVVNVYYSPTDVKRIVFRENTSLYMKSRKGTNIISNGAVPVFQTTAPIEVVSYSEEWTTDNERKSNGKWY